MIVETGQVVCTESDSVWVQTVQQSTCGGCRARHGCGQKLLHQFAASAGEIRARCDHTLLSDLGPGDSVEIGIAEGAVVAASLVTYGLPIVFLVLGAWLGASLDSNVLNALTALAGLLAGALLVRYLVNHYFRSRYFEPVVLRRLPTKVAMIPQPLDPEIASKRL